MSCPFYYYHHPVFTIVCLLFIIVFYSYFYFYFLYYFYFLLLFLLLFLLGPSPNPRPNTFAFSGPVANQIRPNSRPKKALTAGPARPNAAQIASRPNSNLRPQAQSTQPSWLSSHEADVPMHSTSRLYAHRATAPRSLLFAQL